MVSVDLLDPWDHLDWLEPLGSLDVRCEEITVPENNKAMRLHFVY